MFPLTLQGVQHKYIHARDPTLMVNKMHDTLKGVGCLRLYTGTVKHIDLWLNVSMPQLI